MFTAASCTPVLHVVDQTIPPTVLKLYMPEFRHKVVDAETKLPIKGAFIYGSASSYSGTITGGNGTLEGLRTFILETNESGEFLLPAWARTVELNGEPEQQFPSFTIWKRGYSAIQYAGGSLYAFAPNLPEPVRSDYGGNWKDKGRQSWTGGKRQHYLLR